mmetsp:Transcript_58441/g.170918  ORF Transcript_58441/g.170918 Transcript_58441/m.170918 type:complete len:488 (+) Transcript_58441:1531-2994(+)
MAMLSAAGLRRRGLPEVLVDRPEVVLRLWAGQLLVELQTRDVRVVLPDGRPVAHRHVTGDSLLQKVVNQPLVLHVQCRGGLVQQEQPDVWHEKSASYRQALLLAERQDRIPWLNFSEVVVPQCSSKVDSLQHFLQLAVIHGLAPDLRIHQVIAQGRSEHVRPLRHTEHGAVGASANLALPGVPQPVDAQQQGALPYASSAHDEHALPAVQLQADVLQERARRAGGAAVPGDGHGHVPHLELGLLGARRALLADEDEVGVVLALLCTLAPDLVPLLVGLAGLQQVAHLPGPDLLEHGHAHDDAQRAHLALHGADHAEVVERLRHRHAAVQDVVVERPRQGGQDDADDAAADNADHGDEELLAQQAAPVGVQQLLPAPQLRGAALEQCDLLGIVLNPCQDEVDVRVRLQHDMSQWHCELGGIAHDNSQNRQREHGIEEEISTVLEQEVHLDEQVWDLPEKVLSLVHRRLHEQERLLAHELLRSPCTRLR